MTFLGHSEDICAWHMYHCMLKSETSRPCKI